MECTATGPGVVRSVPLARTQVGSPLSHRLTRQRVSRPSADIHDVEYNHVYTHHSNQMMMVKSNGGSGSFYNAQFNNFQGHSNAYTLDVDAFWSSEATAAGSGVKYTNLTFNHWHGTCSDGTQRAPVRILCPTAVPCTEMVAENFYIWTESGSSENYVCESAYGSGGCLKSGTSGVYTTTKAVTSVA